MLLTSILLSTELYLSGTMFLVKLRATNRLFLQTLRFAVTHKLFVILPLGALFFTFAGLVLLGWGVHLGAELNLQPNMPQYDWYLQIAGFLTLIFLIVGINTFSSALLVYMANFKLSGKDISLKEGLQQCWSQRYALISWGVFFTCAGFLLSLLSRAGNFGRFFFKAVDVGWHLCAFLIMPFIMIEQLTPSLAFDKAKDYFPKSAVFQVNILLLLALYLSPLYLLIHLSPYWIPEPYQAILDDYLFYALLLLILFWLTWGAALNAVLKTALYLTLTGQKELAFLQKEEVEKMIGKDKANS